jgi:hypothetical protein
MLEAASAGDAAAFAEAQEALEKQIVIIFTQVRPWPRPARMQTRLSRDSHTHRQAPAAR